MFVFLDLFLDFFFMTLWDGMKTWALVGAKYGRRFMKDNVKERLDQGKLWQTKNVLTKFERGWVIFFSQRLHDFFCPEELHDFFFIPRGCVIFCPKRLRDFFGSNRLRDFFVPRDCMIFLSQKVAWFFLSNYTLNAGSQSISLPNHCTLS